MDTPGLGGRSSLKPSWANYRKTRRKGTGTPAEKYEKLLPMEKILENKEESKDNK